MQSWAAHAGIHAGTHLQHIARDFIVPNVPKRLYAAVQPVHCHRIIFLALLQGNGFQNAARYRIDTAKGVMHLPGAFIFAAIHRNALPAEPLPHFVKEQDSIHGAADLGFMLLGNAWPDEYYLAIWAIGFPKHAAMGHRRRWYGGKLINKFRKIFFHQHIDGWTAGCNQIGNLAPGKDLSVAFGYLCGSDSSLFHAGKSQAAQRFDHTRKALLWKACHKGGGQAYIHLFPTVNHALHFLHVALYLLGILRTDERTFSAKHAVIVDNLRLIVLKGDGFHITISDAFVAVFAVGLLKLNDAHLCRLPFKPVYGAESPRLQGFPRGSGPHDGTLRHPPERRDRPCIHPCKSWR